MDEAGLRPAQRGSVTGVQWLEDGAEVQASCDVGKDAPDEAQTSEADRGGRTVVTIGVEHVLVSEQRGVARLTLNRPQELNMLSQDMVMTMRGWLRRWRSDTGVRTVVLDGAGDHGLCAGGDIRAIYEDALLGGQRSVGLWAEESRLAAEIARFPKPVVALMDGVVMGSGVGISAHASHRIVNSDSVIAMPEVGIGLLPGVAATYLLARAPGELGTHLALTGDRLDAADAIYCGIADRWVPREERSALLAALAETDVDDALGRLSVTPPYESELRSQRSWIDSCYSADRVEDILERLRVSGSSEARSAADRLGELSPTVLKVSLRALRAARSGMSLEDSLRRDFRVAARMLAGHDTMEGIRAQAIDRDGVPTWKPDALEAVNAAAVDAYFAPLGQGELEWGEAPCP